MLRLGMTERGQRRREFLTAGSLALGGLSLAQLTALSAIARERPGLLRDRAVVFLFLQGGPSQFETFDPKPNAPLDIRTVGGTTATSLPGVAFGATMSRLARLADRLTIVRSFQTNNADHNIQPVVGAKTFDAALGSHFARVAGSTHPETGVPRNIVLFPDAVRDDVRKGRARGDLAAVGTLGAACAPFVPGAGGPLQRDMRLNLPLDRFTDRRALVEQLDDLRRKLDAAANSSLDAADRVQEQAYRVLLEGRAAEALDLSREDETTRARYDTSQYVREDGWSKVVRGKEGMYTGHAKALGWQLLLARRLCEAGAGFVTIHDGYDGVWDMHADTQNLNVADGMQAVGLAFDHAVAAFIEDVESRGLAEKILLVVTGEMGRTPRINRHGGRDHWARLAPLVLFGAGAPRGAVVGASTRDGGEPATEPVSPQRMIATVLTTLIDPAEVRLVPSLSLATRLTDHPTIYDLL